MVHSRIVPQLNRVVPAPATTGTEFVLSYFCLRLIRMEGTTSPELRQNRMRLPATVCRLNPGDTLG